MALLFCDSFEHYDVGDILKKWQSLTQMTASAIIPAYGLRPGGMALLAAGNANGYYEKTLASSPATFIAGCYFRTGSTGTASIIMAFLDSTSLQVEVRYTATGLLTFTRNATVLATSTNTLSADTWYHIETKVTVHDTTGNYEVKVDGTSTNWVPAQGGSANTRATSNNQITGVRIYSRGMNDITSNSHRFASYYILDTSGSVANDFLGPTRVAALRPDRPGTHTDFTPNHADNFVNVADLAADGDTTFNQSASAGHIDTFVLDGLPAGTVHAVQHVIMARQDTGSGRTIRPKTRIGSTDYNGTTVAVGATHNFYLEPQSISPATSAQWTASEINGAEFGYERVS